MGGIESKNITHDINTIVKHLMMKSMSECIISVDSETNIDIENVGADVEITHIIVEQNKAVNIKCALAAVKKANIGDKLKDELKKYSNVKGEAVLDFFSSEDSDNVEDLTESINVNIQNVDEDTLNARIKLLVNLSIKDVKGRVKIEGIDIHQTARLVAENIMDISDIADDVDTISKIVNDSTSTEESDLFSNVVGALGKIFTNPLFIIGLVAVAVIVFVVVSMKQNGMQQMGGR
uniref:Uncharacterized protein n=1 Tax=viral metagenome TaxID=1070528 RepID=A0A6C0JDU8_9ZZZZ